MLRGYCGIFTRLAFLSAWPPPQTLTTSTSKPQTTSLCSMRCSITKSQVNDSLPCADHLAAVYSMAFLQSSMHLVNLHISPALPPCLHKYMSPPSKIPLPWPLTSPHCFYPLCIHHPVYACAVAQQQQTHTAFHPPLHTAIHICAWCASPTLMA